MTDLTLSQQVEELAQALLREYMHKKKYYRTLQQFDVEIPRTSKTIGSRAVMADMMHLAPLKARASKSEVPEVEKGTVMEQLCLHRLGKRQMHADGSVLPEDCSDSSLELVRLQENIKKKKKKLKKMRLSREAKQKAQAQKASNKEVAISFPHSGAPRNDALEAGLKLMSTVPATLNHEKRAQVGRGWSPGDGTFNLNAVPLGAVVANDKPATSFVIGGGTLKENVVQEEKKKAPRTVSEDTVTKVNKEEREKEKEKRKKERGDKGVRVQFKDQIIE